MTERERLIELLCSAPLGSKTFDQQYYKSTITKIADYLLENNVKPLLFKIGDIVYGISRGQIIPIQIDTIQYTSKGIDICGSNEEYFGYSTIHLDINNQIGMEWYKTKEEAEKALNKIILCREREMKGNEKR